MIKPQYITRPVHRDQPKPDVASHEDIDWRQVSVAEAIDHDRAHYQAMRGRVEQARAAKPKRTWLTALAELFGIRRMS